MKRNARLKTLRRTARADTIGLPMRAYQMTPRGIRAVNSTRARYLELKRLEKRVHANV